MRAEIGIDGHGADRSRGQSQNYFRLGSWLDSGSGSGSESRSGLQRAKFSCLIAAVLYYSPQMLQAERERTAALEKSERLAQEELRRLRDSLQRLQHELAESSQQLAATRQELQSTSQQLQHQGNQEQEQKQVLETQLAQSEQQLQVRPMRLLRAELTNCVIGVFTYSVYAQAEIGASTWIWI